MSDTDGWAAARAVLSAGGLHEEVTVGERVYQVDLQVTGDDRVEVDFVSCDDDGQLVSHLSGVVPADDLPLAGKVISELLTRAAKHLGVRPAQLRGYSLDEVRRHHPNARTRWTEELDASLLERYNAGASIETLAAQFGRNQGAIVARLGKLGVTVDAPVVTIYDQIGRPQGVAPPSGTTHAPPAAATAPARSHHGDPWQPPQPTGPHFVIQVGGVEGFEEMVELLMVAGAHSNGQRRQFMVTPPLTEGQVAALRRLERFIDGVEVTVVPGGADLCRADPAACEPDSDFRTHDWWAWQGHQHGHPDHRPEQLPRRRDRWYDAEGDLLYE